ncbi:FecR family protein [Steroidobacter sp.]|uniref:FecR family protein n=1 Tax=Steroidobacter sp. TaxID=1978227 RepID=UPI001A3D6C3B|nr:FecR domain-containing protein [Steroidobacter sp.]MBL8265641.1 FecR domain-containing protein [Steroidobacter sp.]
MRPLEDASRDIVAQQAAQWLCELPHSDAARRVAFVQWLKRSPTHIEEFLLASTVCASFARERGNASDDVERLIAEALQAPPSAEVMQLHALADERPKVAVTRPRRGWMAAAAAVCVLAIGALLIVPWSIDRLNTYTTRTGEQRTIRLEDGSRVQMNARSRFIVRYSAEARDLELLEGEAVFDVQHDTQRPFRVHTRDAVIQAVGTQFNVYRQASGRTVVSVLEGVVRVTRDAEPVVASAVSTAESGAPLLVRAGQGADVSHDGAIEKRESADIARVMSWQNRRLVFREDRLEDIAHEFARYSPFHLELDGAAVKDKRITGTFDADDPQSLVMFLDSLGTFQIETSGQGAAIAPRL